MKKIYSNFEKTLFEGKMDETIYIRPCVLEELNRLTFLDTIRLYNFEIQSRNVILEVVPNYYRNAEIYERAKLEDPSIVYDKIFL